MSAKQDLKKIFDRIEKVLGQAVNRTEMRSLANLSIDLIYKRTKLGYGVREKFGSKSPLRKLSPAYIAARKKSSKLSGTTSPSKSNLTFTGQMLDSLRILKESSGEFLIGPSGQRRTTGGKFSLTNAKVAEYQAKQGRIFNNLSALEFNQLLRQYRRDIDDLLNRARL